ncbi:MAG TPA: methylated-DNA--[protein]-cysteine S-methyltransferase, partial [Gammaproteobacteria bacterium]
APFVTPGAEPAAQMLQCYLDGRSVAASAAVPLQPPGTPFQQAVWQQLQRIPFGSVCTYGELARRLNSAPRAVAGACRANPLPLLIPCHRVVASNGVGGYLGQTSGHGLALKQWLLQHEGYV